MLDCVDEVEQVSAMFESLDLEVVIHVLECCGGDIGRAIARLSSISLEEEVEHRHQKRLEIEQ